MKKKFCILIFMLVCMILSATRVNAISFSCPKTSVTAGTDLTCNITIEEGDDAVQVSSSLTIKNVTGDMNTKYAKTASFATNGTVVFKTDGLAGDYKILAEDVSSSYTNTVTVHISEATTTTKTTTTTTKPKSDNNYLSSITIDGKEIENFSKNTTKYFVDVDNSVKKVTIKAKQEDETAEVTIDGPNNLAIGDNEYTISVTSENESTKYYKIIITRADEEESSSTEIKSIKIKGYNLNFDKTSKTFHLNIKPEDTQLDITVKLKDENASYEIEDNDNLQDGSVIKIIVTAEDETTDTYRIIVSKKSSNILPIIIGSVSALLIIIVIILIVINNKKKKNNPKNTDSNQPKIQKENNNEVKKDSIIEEKTIEMPAISTPDESAELSSLDEEDNIPYDNDEEEETRILSYAEQKELERVNKELIEEENEKASKEIDKALEKILDFEYENDEEDE